MLPPLSKAPLRVWMSMSPAVRSPNSAGRAPVTSDRLPIKAVSSTWLKPETPSGRMMPLMRY
jgi:hypothetical protein